MLAFTMACLAWGCAAPSDIEDHAESELSATDLTGRYARGGGHSGRNRDPIVDLDLQSGQTYRATWSDGRGESGRWAIEGAWLTLYRAGLSGYTVSATVMSTGARVELSFTNPEMPYGDFWRALPPRPRPDAGASAGDAGWPSDHPRPEELEILGRYVRTAPSPSVSAGIAFREFTLTREIFPATDTDPRRLMRYRAITESGAADWGAWTAWRSGAAYQMTFTSWASNGNRATKLVKSSWNEVDLERVAPVGDFILNDLWGTFSR